MSYNIYGRTSQEILDPLESNEFKNMAKEHFFEKEMKIMIGNTA